MSGFRGLFNQAGKGRGPAQFNFFLGPKGYLIIYMKSQQKLGQSNKSGIGVRKRIGKDWY